MGLKTRVHIIPHHHGSDESHEEGTGHEGHESCEGNEDDNESREGDEGEQNRKGQASTSQCVQWQKGETNSGMKKNDLIKNKNGRIVSKKSSAASKKRFQGSRIQKWMKACAAARKELKITGFVALNSGAQGKALYAKAKALFAKA